MKRAPTPTTNAVHPVPFADPAPLIVRDAVRDGMNAYYNRDSESLRKILEQLEKDRK